MGWAKDLTVCSFPACADGGFCVGSQRAAVQAAACGRRRCGKDDFRQAPFDGESLIWSEFRSRSAVRGSRGWQVSSRARQQIETSEKASVVQFPVHSRIAGTLLMEGWGSRGLVVGGWGRCCWMCNRNGRCRRLVALAAIAFTRTFILCGCVKALCPPAQWAHSRISGLMALF